MKDKKVISPQNFPRKMPLHLTLTLALSLKVFNAPQWLIGATGFLVLLFWISWLVSVVKFEEIETDIFKDK